MAKMLDIKIDPGQLKKLKKTLSGFPNGLRRGMVSAINKTTRSGKTKVARGIFGLLNMKLSDIKKGIKTRPATGRRWIGEINLVETKRIPLIQFGAKDLARGGVRYKIERGGGAVKIGDAEQPVFIATMPTGHEGVFKIKQKRTDATPSGWRDPVGSPSAGRKLVELRGPSPAVAFQVARPVMARAEREIHRDFMRNLNSQVDRFIGEKLRKGGGK